MSTENLLLNAYRQEQFGIPGILQIDCTHRVVLEGHVCMLFGTVDAAQHFHTVGDVSNLSPPFVGDSVALWH